jgi:TRAP-type C4-dicarboxylate transport system substrate-binding protein
MYARLPFKISGLVAGAVLASAMSHAANAEEWKFAIEEIQGSVQDACAQEFKRLIEEKTGGEVTVTINQEELEKLEQEKPEMQTIELTEDEHEAFRARSMQAREAFVETTGEQCQQILDALVADIQAAEQEVGTN